MKPKWECHLRAFVLLWIFLGIPTNIKTTESSHQNEDLHQHHISDFLAEASSAAPESIPCPVVGDKPDVARVAGEPALNQESVAQGSAERTETENVQNLEANYVEEIPAAIEPLPVDTNDAVPLENQLPDEPVMSPTVEEDVPIQDSTEEAASEILAAEVRLDTVGESNVTGIASERMSVNESSTSHSEGTDEIPSFSEWTQKVLAEAEKSGGTNHSIPTTTAKTVSSSKLRQKNYASPDCGAKLLSANPEAQHVSAVLDPARDEYLLSICSSKTWFVVELCEAIQAKRVEIANFELFSSSPRDFRVFISDRYPTREWALVGQFTATDERSIQSFSLQQQFFGKFVKVELDSHYGTRYYCPISLFRVYGTSEYEVLNTEDEQRSHFDATDEETLDDVKAADSQEPGNLFDSATKAVLDMVKKATGVFAKTGQPMEVNGPNITIQTRTDPSRCRSVRQTQLAQVSDGINSTLSCGWEKLGQLTSLPWLQASLAGLCSNQSTDVTVYSKELELAEMIYGTALLAAVCHWAQIADISYRVVPAVVPCIVVPAPVNPVNLSKIPDFLGENADVDELPSMSPTVSDLEVLEAWFPEVPEVAVIPASEMPTTDAVPKYDGLQTNGAGNATADPKFNSPVSANNGQGSAQQKESVFVRLSNRIKALERNMSLSSQYLEELSRRYKRQVDDMQKTLNKTILTLNETLQQMSLKEQQQQQDTRLLNSEIADLKKNFETLLQENLTLRAQMVEHHIFLMVVELILVAALYVFCARRYFRRQSDGQPFERRTVLPITLETPSKVQELTVPVGENLSGIGRQHISPVPSISGSTTSSCDSAFSYKVSGSNRSRDPSPGSSIGKLKKKKKKRKNLVMLASDGHVARFPGQQIRLKSDNWQWHSRASTLASALIKENIEPPGGHA